MKKKAGRPQLYDEPKQRLELSLTATALEWLQNQKDSLNAPSISDTLEKLARNN
jgi:hypothetical protein